MKTSKYEIRETWEDAIRDTPIELAPMAIRLNKIDSLPDIDAKLSDMYHPFALIAMTTRYQHDRYDEELGWMHLDSETKQMLSDFLYASELTDTWVFIAQIPEK